MSQKSIKTKNHSQITRAITNCIVDMICIVCNIGIIIIHQKQKEPYHVETFDIFSHTIQTILILIILLALIFIHIFSSNINSHTEKDDELSLLHKYKAGYISKTISAFIFAIVIFIVKDFSFAFTGDFIDFWGIPAIIIITSDLISSITFIILEKFQLD